jgi:demethylmenaquinone methyltransferase/2-methoxy-6-polyprenyl-1,4-benzoquinol methylase
VRTDNLIDLYDATTWYWDSRFYRSVYQRSYLSLFRRLERQGWLGEQGSPLRVLDCGIGTGLLTTCLLAVVDGHVELFGVDTSAGMLARAHSRLRDTGAEPSLSLGNICHLPFHDHEMDLVMAALVLEHVPMPADALREMVRVAKPGAAVLLIATKAGAPDWPFRLWFRYRPFATERLVKWMMAADIRNISIEPLPGLGHPFACAYIGLAGRYRGQPLVARGVQ